MDFDKRTDFDFFLKLLLEKALDEFARSPYHKSSDAKLALYREICLNCIASSYHYTFEDYCNARDADWEEQLRFIYRRGISDGVRLYLVMEWER